MAGYLREARLLPALAAWTPAAIPTLNRRYDPPELPDAIAKLRALL